MRFAVIVLGVAVVVAVLVAATHASPRPAGVGATVVVGADFYELGSRSGTCQTAGGDISIESASDGDYFRLLRTREDHGHFRSVVWHFSRREEGVLLGATITVGKNADGQTSGTFSGSTTKNVRATGSFICA